MGVSVSEALHKATSGDRSGKAPINEPVYMLIADTLFRIANSPDPKKRGSIRKATQAQKMILDRMVGKRLPGSNPAARKAVEINFVDLTVASIGGAHESGDGEPEVPQADS